MLANLSFSTPWPTGYRRLLTGIVKPLKVESNAEYREIGIRSHCKGIFHKSPVTGKQLGSKRVFWVEPGCLVLNIVFAWNRRSLSKRKRMGNDRLSPISHVPVHCMGNSAGVCLSVLLISTREVRFGPGISRRCWPK